MPSFAMSSRFREGQWVAFRKFMLEERRDASSRFSILDAERSRIGEITIFWKADANGYATEERIGFEVGPEGTSLYKLVEAYVMLGGNPFDISMFLSPLQTGGDANSEPGRGILTSDPISYAMDVGVTDGDVNMLKFKMSRMGGPGFKSFEKPVRSQILMQREWVSQEMRFKRWRLEEQIIKLMDLREQLHGEAIRLLWATGGDMYNTYDKYTTDRYNDSLTAGYVAYFFDSTFRVPSEEAGGKVSVLRTEAGEGLAGAINRAALASYPNLMEDYPEEAEYHG